MITRLSNLKELLNKDNLDAALISSVPDIIYLTGFSHFSAHEREAFLLITQNTNYIFTDARYSHAVKKHIDNFTLLEIGHGKSFSKLLENTITKEKITTLGIDGTDLTVHEYEKIHPLVKETKHFGIDPLRLIKDAKEIESINKACELGDEAFVHIVKHIKEGMTEKEIAFELEHFIRKNGAEPSFPTIIAFEENAAIPHHKTGEKKLQSGEFILLDFGVLYENYCSDMTRTICLGQASEEKKRIHQTVLEAQKKAILLLTSESKSISASELDKAARDYIIDQDYPSIPHSLGHGIGLEVHEAPSLSPNSKDTLKEGMIFSIEPGIYLNDDCGVRIEDLFAIHNNTVVQLTTSSKELLEI